MPIRGRWSGNPRHPATAVRFEWDEGNGPKLEKRGIFSWHVEEVHANRPEYRRNKRSGSARWAMIGRDDDGRLLRVNIIWSDEKEGILRAVGGWEL
ncbi:MAG: hypothetical protein HYU87_12260 [Chloroflexi bacterium]|nr:hypothetical protein [Chloroflexota bacterium]